MTPGSQHPLRCETCGYRYHRDIWKCPFDFEDAYYLLKDEMQLPRGAWLLTSVVGCASHTSARSEQEIREQVLNEMIKLSEMIEGEETEKWEDVGRPQNDGYINGSHSGYSHATRDFRKWIDTIKIAMRRQQEERKP